MRRHCQTIALYTGSPVFLSQTIVVSRWFVTVSYTHLSRKALIELDGRPAADVYSAELDIPRDKIIDNVLVNPMGRAVGDQVFISSMNGMDADGTLTNYKRINKNDCIYFLSLGDYKATEQKTRQQIQQDASHISLVLSIDCIYRYLLYEKEGYFST